MKREENQTVEYKESWHDKYLEWICGYANARGGTLYIGIEDATKKPVGVAKANKLSEDIPNMIRDTMGLVADVAILKKSGKDVIRIKVKPSAFPVSYHGGYFYRTGSVKMQLTGSAFTQFILEKTGRAWDTSVANGDVRLPDYTFIALNNRYRLIKGVKLTKSDFISFGLANESGALTNTGALLADESPIAHSRIFCTRWNGLDMTAGTMDAADAQEYTGGLLQLLKYAEDFVRLHTRRSWHKRPEDRVDFYEYPSRSITEMIINGLVHRDYLAYGSEVHIDIFDDRIEITSPGGMPGDRRVQDYPNPMRIPSCRRNRTLADVFERLEFMERKGSGFKKLFEDYDRLSVNLGHRRPVLESEDVYFRVTLPNLLYGFTDEQLVAATDRAAQDTHHDTHHDTIHDERAVDDRMLRVLKALKGAPLGMSELRETLRIRDRATVRESYLRPCFQACLVELTLPGAKRSRLQKYRLTEKGRERLAALQSQLEGKEAETIKLHETIKSQPKTTEVTTEETTEVFAEEIRRVVVALKGVDSCGLSELMIKVGMREREDFRKRYLKSAMSEGCVEPTQPQSPRSPTQRYRLTDKGRKLATALDLVLRQ